MANKLKSYKPTTRSGPPQIYKWDQWLDGQWWRLKAGKDFNCSVDSMADMFRRNARKLGWIVEVHKEEDAIVVRTKAKIATVKAKKKKRSVK